MWYARVLVDCGASPDLAAFDAATLDAVVLTHAHPQHADGLAVLVRNGFAGALVATPYTLRMADIRLRDAVLDAGFAVLDGEIIEWLGHGTEPTMTYVVHGSPGVRTALRNRVRGTLGWHAETPTSGRATHVPAPVP